MLGGLWPDGLADDIAEGKATTDAAIVEARAVIAKETSGASAR